MAKEKTYSEKLQHPKWQKKRLEILKRDKFTCKKCKDQETTLHVHHIEYWNDMEPWDYPNWNYITLCKDCHEEVEFIKDENDISEIHITKITGWSTGGRLVIVTGTEFTNLKFYNGKNEVEINLAFKDNDISYLKTVFTKLLKRHGKKNDGHSEMEQTVSEEHGSPL